MIRDTRGARRTLRDDCPAGKEGYRGGIVRSHRLAIPWQSEQGSLLTGSVFGREISTEAQDARRGTMPSGSFKVGRQTWNSARGASFLPQFREDVPVLYFLLESRRARG